MFYVLDSIVLGFVTLILFYPYIVFVYFVGESAYKGIKNLIENMKSKRSE